MTGIKNLPDLINKHRKKVGRTILEQLSQKHFFNSYKYGVYDLNFKTVGRSNDQAVQIAFFKTDHFTHLVFRSIYQQLRDDNHEFKEDKPKEFVKKYKPFLTSFAINCLLICRNGGNEVVVLNKRSHEITGGSGKYHITMNEGLTDKDKNKNGKIDLKLCFKRGLEEEIGDQIKESPSQTSESFLYDNAINKSFHDFFLDRNKFEIGLSSSIELNVEYREIEKFLSKDRNKESDAFFPIPLDKDKISNCIKQNTFVKHGVYVLDRVLRRKGIIIIDTIGNY